MRHRSTVYNREEHRQFGETPDEIRKSKERISEDWKKDEKEGQSEFRIKNTVKKKVLGKK